MSAAAKRSATVPASFSLHRCSFESEVRERFEDTLFMFMPRPGSGKGDCRKYSIWDRQGRSSHVLGQWLNRHLDTAQRSSWTRYFRLPSFMMPTP